MAFTNANPATGDGGARQVTLGKELPAVNSRITNPTQAPIRAELVGDTCTAAGVTARGNAPALVLCRELIAAGVDPDRALTVFRNGVLSLRVRSIREGAQLTVAEDNRGTPRFVSYRPGPAERARIACGEAPPVRQTDHPLCPVLEAAG